MSYCYMESEIKEKFIHIFVKWTLKEITASEADRQCIELLNSQLICKNHFDITCCHMSDGKIYIYNQIVKTENTSSL